MPDPGIFQFIGESVDAALASFVMATAQSVISAIMPIATLGATLYFSILGYMMIAGGLALIDGNQLPQAPKWVHNLTARYSVGLGDGSELYVYTDWAYRSEVNFFLYDSIEFTGTMASSTAQPCVRASSATRKSAVRWKRSSTPPSGDPRPRGR